MQSLNIIIIYQSQLLCDFTLARMYWRTHELTWLYVLQYIIKKLICKPLKPTAYPFLIVRACDRVPGKTKAVPARASLYLCMYLPRKVNCVQACSRMSAPFMLSRASVFFWVNSVAESSRDSVTWAIIGVGKDVSLFPLLKWIYVFITRALWLFHYTSTGKLLSVQSQ